MLKKHINKVLIIILALVLIPFSFVSENVYAGTNSNTSVLVNSKYTFYAGDEIKSSASKDVVVEQVANPNNIKVFEDSTFIDGTESVISNVSYANGYVSVVIGSVGEYQILVKSKSSDGQNIELTYTENVKVVNDINSLEKPKYILDTTNLGAYQDKVNNACFEEGDTQKPIYPGNKIEIPSIKEVFNGGSLGYAQYKRSIYVAMPGNSDYVNKGDIAVGNTADEFSFTTGEIGVYSFYVVFESDNLATSGEAKYLSLTTEGLFEKEDGFYKGYSDAGKAIELFAKRNNLGEYVYYENEDSEVEVVAAVEELVIPVFTFEITDNAAPKVEYTGKSTLENGYVGLKYTINKFEVNGYKTTSTYKLFYSKTGKANTWTEVEDEDAFDASTLTFTPDNIGYYKVNLSVIDANDRTAYAESTVIYVPSAPKTPKYKTSFSEWLEVNTVPFIFLCISFACFVAILCLLFIKPKAKTDTVTEEDR